MKVGDYVRFYDRSWTEIGQIVGEVEDSHLKVVKCRDGYYDLDNFIKYGSIIDVIEVGDYVNGYKVSFSDKEPVMGEFVQCDYEVSFGTTNHYRFYKADIKSIVTKEAFESMEYRTGE